MSVAERIQFAISIFLQIAIAAVGVYAAFIGQWMTAFTSALGVLVTFLPALFERNLRVYLPVEFTLIVTFFTYAAITLGTAHGFYTQFFWWDMLLHGSAGLALGFLGFLILYILYFEEKLSMSAFLLSFFSFMVAVAAGTLWEIFEFVVDVFGGFNMQDGGLTDTMGDLILNAAGGLIAAVIGYFYIRNVRLGLFHHLIRKFIQKNEWIKRRL